MPGRARIPGLCLLLAASATAGEPPINWELIDRPRAIPVGDATIRTRWWSLFEARIDWPARTVSYLQRRTGDLGPTLLSARLVYRDAAWTRRDSDSVPKNLWAATDRSVRLAVLREIRWNRNPAFTPLLQQLLSTESDPEIAAAALTTAWLLDPAAAVQQAVRLADPRRGDHLPAAESPSPGARQAALDLLVGVGGVDDPGARQALDWALLAASGPERLHAVTMVPDAGAQDLLRRAILRLVKEWREGTLDDHGSAALVLAAVRIDAGSRNLDRDLVEAFLDLCLRGPRPLAAAAAHALTDNPGWSAGDRLPLLASRASRAGEDPVVRQVLLNLLVRLQPKAAAEAAGSGDPWAGLAEHRRRLAAWEWGQYVK